MFFPMPPKKEPDPADRPAEAAMTPSPKPTDSLPPPSGSEPVTDGGVPSEGSTSSSSPVDRLFASRLGGKIALGPLIVVVLACAMESVPGWGSRWLQLRLSPGECFMIVVACGFIGGGLGAVYRLPGAVAGAVCMAGAFTAVWALLSVVDRVFNIVILLAMTFGILPGAFLYACAESAIERRKVRICERRS